jgi:ribonuclease HI
MIKFGRIFTSLVLDLFTVSIVIHFDGALRHPTDRGFGFSTQLQARRATCAAFIQLSDEDNAGSFPSQLLGGQILNCSASTSSAEVEYHGLILGLEGLLSFWQGTMTDSSPTTTSALCAANGDSPIVQILGDCKTVLHQMEGLSRPRRLESFHEHAMRMLQELRSIQPNVEFRFQHIPRSQNQLCDRLSARILAEKEQKDYQDIILVLENLFDHSSDTKGGSIARFLDRHLRVESNGVPFSQRPLIYWRLAQLAFEVDDWQSLVFLGEWWETELLDAWPRAHTVGKTQQVCFKVEPRDLFLVEALVFQLVGLEALGKMKDATTRRRKKRYLLGRFANHIKTTEERLSNLTNRDEDSLRLQYQLYNKASDTEMMEPWPYMVQDWYAEATETAKWNSHGLHWSIYRAPANLASSHLPYST